MGPDQGGVEGEARTVVRFHPSARRELNEAYDWCSDRSVQAAEKFLVTVEHAVLRIQDDAKSHPVIARGYRYVRVSGFPHCLVDSIDGPEVMIWAVAHMSRRPQYWARRRTQFVWAVRQRSSPPKTSRNAGTQTQSLFDWPLTIVIRPNPPGRANSRPITTLAPDRQRSTDHLRLPERRNDLGSCRVNRGRHSRQHSRDRRHQHTKRGQSQ